MKKSEIDAYVLAGRIARDVKKFAREMIKPQMKLIEIAEAIDAKITDFGGEPAFPVTLSLNDIAAHYTPASNDETIAEGILKVDIGVHVEGFIADTAFSIDLTPEKKFENMIQLNEKILENITRTIEPRIEVCRIGDVAQDTLESWNKKEGTRYSIIKSLSGHALAQDTIHAGLTISNYRNSNRFELQDIAFAIEPFVTTGVGEIYEGNVGGIFVLNSDEPVRDKDSREVLKFVRENYKTRPFCSRWLERKNFNKLKFVLSNLVKQGILHEYPMLIEKSKMPISQVENTFLINKDGVKITTI